ncbi:hypothetical protein JCM10449v2_000609 [Rhodotorula kratochvilovae]
MSPTSASPLSTTAPGSVSLTLGGVAGNVAATAHALLGGSAGETLLVAAVADDLLGGVARRGLAARGMRDDGLVGAEGATATCGILLDQKGELVGGVADMRIASALSGETIVERIKEARPKVVCFDGNIEAEAMVEVLLHCEKAGIPTFFEPTSNAKSLKLLKALSSPRVSALLPLSTPLVSFSTPNIHELQTLYDKIAFSDSAVYAPGAWFDGITVPSAELATLLPPWTTSTGAAQMALRLLPLVRTLLVKAGADGVLAVQRVSGVDAVAAWRALPRRKGTVVVPSESSPAKAVVLRHYPALPLLAEDVVGVTGAGDSLAGATLAALVRGLRADVPGELDRIADLAQRAAIATLKSSEAVGDHAGLRELLPGA